MLWILFQVDRGSEEPDSESGSASDRRPSEPGGKAGSESPKGAARGARGDSLTQEEHDGGTTAAKAAANTTNGINGIGA